jgi:low affinity Fe/Cu permease
MMVAAAPKNGSKKGPNSTRTNGGTNGGTTGNKPKHWFNEALDRFSRKVTAWSGSSMAFALAVLTVLVWATTGPLFHYSDTWQLVINTGTTIVTFLMVFLIQRAQNKDSMAIQIKLNELLASQQGASNRLINLEDWSEEDIAALHERFENLSERLQHVSDQCESHSINEAKEALDDANQAIQQATPKLARKSRRSNGKSHRE